MIKIISPSGWDFERQVAGLVKVSSRGLIGNDRADLIKSAGAELVRAIDGIKMASGEEPVHVLALGELSHWGANRNGDGFEEHECRACHPSFVKFARWYRSHKNRPPHPSYGVVKASIYNEPMRRVELLVGLNATKEAAERNGGLVADKELEKLARGEDLPVSMSCSVPHDVCFAAGTLVETARGLLAIERVAATDLLKTHCGAYKPIVRTMRRAYSGTMVTLRVFGLPESITATAGHPFLVVRQEDVRACRGAINGRRRRHTFRGSDTCTTCAVEVDVARRWTESKRVAVGDYVVYPVQPPGSRAIDTATAYLLGVYTGDGCLIRRRRGRKRDGVWLSEGIVVTCDNAQPGVLARVREAAKARHGREQPTYPSGCGRDSVQVPIYDQNLAGLCAELIGTGSKTKRIDEVVFDFDREGRLAFLAGVLDSDGSVDYGHHSGTGRIATVNRDLADRIQKLFWGLGIPVTINRQVVTNGYNPGVACYHVVVPVSGVVALAAYSDKASRAVPPKYTRSRAFVLDGYMHLPVTEVTQRYDECDVYNFSVADDETYIASVAVHNCSFCGNKARTRSEYCKAAACGAGGCADNLAKLVKVGGDVHHLHVRNVSPRFFDMSLVYRGADRTAFGASADWMSKAAADAAGECVGGALLAELAGLSAPMDVAYDQELLSCTSEGARQQLKLARAMHDIDETPLAQAGGDVLYAFAGRGNPELSFLGRPGTKEAAAGLAALADQKIVLPLHAFAVWTGRPDQLDGATRVLPGVYGRMIGDGSLAVKLAANRYAPSGAGDMSQRRAAFLLKEAFGLGEDDVQLRCWRAFVRRDPEPKRLVGYSTVKSAADVGAAPAADELARDYAAYQLAALHKIAAFDDAFLLTVRLCMAQNHVASGVTPA